MEKRLKEFILIVTTILVMCGVFAVLSWLFPERWGGDVVVTETEEVRTDTVRDTIYVDRPMLVDETLIRREVARLPFAYGHENGDSDNADSDNTDYADGADCADYDDGTDSELKNSPMIGGLERIGDSVDVVVPITQSVYEGAEYRAWVSGFHASLDSLHIFREQFETTRTITRTVREKRKPWVVSVGVGYGMGKDGMQPYVGVNVGWRIWEF